MVAGLDVDFLVNLGNFNDIGFGASGIEDKHLSIISLNVLAIVFNENLFLG